MISLIIISIPLILGIIIEFLETFNIIKPREYNDILDH